MAETKTQKSTKKTDDYKAPEKTPEIQEELNLDVKVTVKSIAGWDTGFARKIDGIGDVNIAPNGSVRLSRNEIIGQVQSGNKLFTGVDGVGSHATLYIDDKATRLEVEFETEDTAQNVFSDSKVEKLFKAPFDEFKARLAEEIYTRAEKYAVIEAIKRLGLNDYSKIRFIEEYTGYKVQ